MTELIKRYENPKKRERLRTTGWLKRDPSGDSDSSIMEDGENVRPDDVCTDASNLHNVITSTERYEHALLPNQHYPCLDIDVPVRFVQSSQPGHYHMFIDKSCDWYDYVAFLQAAAKIGLLEQGYVNASIARGYTAVFIQEY